MRYVATVVAGIVEAYAYGAVVRRLRAAAAFLVRAAGIVGGRS